MAAYSPQAPFLIVVSIAAAIAMVAMQIVGRM